MSCKLTLTQFKKQNKFTDIDFRKCTYFTNKTYSDKEFYNCNFIDVNLYKTKLTNVLFMNSQLDGAKFGSADLSQAYINDCTLTNADLSNTNLESANISNSDLTNANLTNAIIISSSSEAQISGTNLTNAVLTNANLTGAIIYDSNLTNANLSGANLTNVSLMSSNINLTGANLTGANLSNVDLEGSDLTNANLTNANLSSTNFTSAILTDTNSTGANVSEAIGWILSPETPISSPTEFSPIIKQIPHNQQAIDQIEGDVEMAEFLKENADYIALLFGQNYYLIDKSRLSNMINKTGNDNRLDNQIVYECKVAGSMRTENIVLETPLMKLGPIGLMNYSYIPVKDIKKVIERVDKMYELIETRKVQSVVSFQIVNGLGGNTRGVSASHCQAGQNGTVYKLRKIVPETNKTNTRKRKPESKTESKTDSKTKSKPKTTMTKTKTKKRKFGRY
jgi:uncharacterized protein YjbI with pentapeptide repeats